MTRSRGRGSRAGSLRHAPTHSRPDSVTHPARPSLADAVLGAVAPAGAAALTSRALLYGGRWLPRHLRDAWSRTNHSGRPVTLLEGPAWVGGALAGAAVAGVLDARRGSSGRPATLATAVVAVASGLLGALDDLAGGGPDKGLRGHLGALARGEVTTGAVKVVGLGLTGLVGTAILDRADGRRSGRGLLTTLVGGAVVAGAANAVNLFDLRPGRALKVTVGVGMPLVGHIPAAAAVGASLGVARDDLTADSMLGDTGANAAGALVGLAVVERLGLPGRAAALLGLVALTLASERVSFTKVIEGNPVLRRIDEWGRGAS